MAVLSVAAAAEAQTGCHCRPVVAVVVAVVAVVAAADPRFALSSRSVHRQTLWGTCK